MQFSELNLSSHLKNQLAVNQFVTPTPVQEAAIPPAMEGKDVLATAQTGTGKTLGFLLPAMERLLATKGKHPAVLILTPTRELALQVEKQYAQLAGKSLPQAATLIGGASENNQIRDLKAGARLIVATPGRLEDFLERRLIDLKRIEVLVLDEADRMLDMGFIPAIRRIVAKLPRQRQTMCFSATIDPAVAHLLDEILTNPVRLSFGSTQQTSSSVRLIAYEVDADQKAALVHRVVTAEEGQSLVFVGTKRRTEHVAKRLDRAGISVAVLHGDRSQSQRNRALEDFQRGRARVLVATDVASRGIHVDNIAQVINYDMPKMTEDFIHRAGRTGRAGATGVAATFYTPLERREFNRFEKTLNRKIERVMIASDSGLDREERGQMVNHAPVLRMATVAPTKPRGKGKGKSKAPAAAAPQQRVYLEGERLQRYAN
ncbi:MULTISPECIES: DEAD/DEAH box helicase [Acidobacterium]|uniref:ATP-dependent RNA helicase n=1 Tax=Acidobacterium capsulatum (strain ATCC 51196 / DSM 11244 / BCRC 80197 / JCM 7670 / NBRC 15755 / NCIMB 13165 / 161) TaxID=240015 RepID=C1FAF2_ACIC5|nr:MULTISPECIES: DEAD/DEAH box helicase [Acidobacterium]ACO33748.1 ATP-dependent RNA helicase [Acidobacterium capsulatum ATCC 51196]